MKISISCSEISCLAKQEILISDFVDEYIYKLNCSCGHENKILLKNPKHDVLFTISLNAIHDGYFREAIASLSASLERYYEFIIHLFMSSQKTDNECVLFDDANNIPKDNNYYWQLMSSQSERQLGAYIALWAFNFGERPKLLNPNNKYGVKLRNEVVHKGKIPTRDECIGFGDAVLDIIRYCENKISSDYNRTRVDLIFEKVRKTEKDSILTISSALADALKSEMSFLDCIERQHQIRKIMLNKSSVLKEYV